MTHRIEGFLDAFKAKAARVPEQVFARFNGEPITFGELDALSSAFAAHLRHLGVARGDRVAVMMRNSRYSLALLFGLAKAGIVWVPVNVQLKGDGLAYIVAHCGADTIVCDADVVPVLADCGVVVDAYRLIVAGDATAENRLEAIMAEHAPFDEELPGAQDLFAIMYTSGTTGRPKGVPDV